MIKTTLKNTLYAGGIITLYFSMLCMFNLNFLQFQFFTFLIQACVLLIFAFKNIKEIRLQQNSLSINYLPAFAATAILLCLSLYIYCFGKLILLFKICPDYLINCVEEMKVAFMESASTVFNDEKLIQTTLESFEILKKPISILSQMMVYYPFKSILIGAAVALVAKKKESYKDNINL